LPNGRRRPLRQWSAPLISVVLAAALMVAGSTLLTAADPAAAAPSSASDLQRRLEGLNRQADQQVEDYLQAKLAVERTRNSISIMQQQLDGVRSQLTDARASIAARAAVAYVQGPANDLASLLAAGDPWSSRPSTPWRSYERPSAAGPRQLTGRRPRRLQRAAPPPLLHPRQSAAAWGR
jgi:hypothetical protein